MIKLTQLFPWFEFTEFKDEKQFRPNDYFSLVEESRFEIVEKHFESGAVSQIWRKLQ